MLTALALVVLSQGPDYADYISDPRPSPDRIASAPAGLGEVGGRSKTAAVRLPKIARAFSAPTASRPSSDPPTRDGAGALSQPVPSRPSAAKVDCPCRICACALCSCENPPLAKASDKAPPISKAMTVARETKPQLAARPKLPQSVYRCADASGQVWTHADAAYLEQWVRQRNARMTTPACVNGRCAAPRYERRGLFGRR